MIIKKGGDFYLVERVVKKNIISESRGGNLFLRSRLFLENPVCITSSRITDDVITEENTKDIFNIKNINNIINLPIEGDFMITDNGASCINGVKGLYNKNIVNLNNNFYLFNRIANCPIEQKNKRIMFYRVKSLKRLKKFVNFENADFFLKIPLKNLERIEDGKAKCGIVYKIYKIINDGSFSFELLGKIAQKSFNKTLMKMEGGAECEVKYYSTKVKYSKTRMKTGHIGFAFNEPDVLYFGLAEIKDIVSEGEVENILIKIPAEFILEVLD